MAHCQMALASGEYECLVDKLRPARQCSYHCVITAAVITSTPVGEWCYAYMPTWRPNACVTPLSTFSAGIGPYAGIVDDIKAGVVSVVPLSTCCTAGAHMSGRSADASWRMLRDGGGCSTHGWLSILVFAS
jgi:hypothetical protein